MRWGSWLSAVAVSLIASAAGAAQGVHPAAQGLFPGGQDQGDLPVQIDAKSLVVHDKSKIATFSGNVKVVQGDTTMTCNTLVVFYGEEMGLSGNKPPVDASSNAGAVPDAQHIRRIEARGDVTVVSKDQTATGDLGVYDLPKKTITLSGNVVVSQGKNVIHGGVVIVDTVTGNAHVEPALGTPDGRVRALIIPQKGSNGSESNYLTIGPGPRH